MKKSDGIIQNHWLHKGIEKVFSSREKIVNRVNRGLEINNSDKNKNADFLIRGKVGNATAIGAGTGLLSLIPVMGTIGAVATTMTAEFVYVSYKEIELCMEIACNYGFDLDDQLRIFEILAIVGRKREIKNAKGAEKIAKSKALRTVIRRYVRVGILKALSRAAKFIEIRAGLRIVTKAVPVVGSVAGGTINFFITRNTGLIAKEFYKNGALEGGNGEEKEQKAVSRKKKAVSRKKKAVSRKKKAASRKQKEEGSKQKEEDRK